VVNGCRAGGPAVRAACGGDQERRPERQPGCLVAAVMAEGAVMVVIVGNGTRGSSHLHASRQSLTSRSKRVDRLVTKTLDLRDLRLVGRFDYFQVPPSQRLWIWEDDLEQARQDLDLPT
jgi:hypothetical protein